MNKIKGASLMGIIDFGNENSKNKITNTDNEYYQDLFRQFQDSIFDGSYEEDDEESVYDYLELAENAATDKQAEKYIKKALEIEPDNVDALLAKAKLTSKSDEDLLKKLEKIIADAQEQLKTQGYFNDEYVGDFWTIYETRPYMNVRYEYIAILMNCTMMSKAEAECEDMLRLCENDNLGIRYFLMHIYAHFEDEKKALELFKKYDNEKTTGFLLPLSALYYKLGNLKKSVDYLKKLKEVNSDTLGYFYCMASGRHEKITKHYNPYSYKAGSMEEFAVITADNIHVYSPMISYFDWAFNKLSKMKD
ncbi:MAG: tetratricopeptide repeat protein [Acutalibacteraceae bacterium]